MQLKFLDQTNQLFLKILSCSSIVLLSADYCELEFFFNQQKNGFKILKKIILKEQ